MFFLAKKFAAGLGVGPFVTLLANQDMLNVYLSVNIRILELLRVLIVDMASISYFSSVFSIELTILGGELWL